MIISVVIRVVEGARELLVGPLCSVAITLNQAVYSAPLHLPQAQDFLLVLPRNQRPGSAPVDSEEEHQHHHFLGHRRQLHQVRFSVLQLQAAILAVFLEVRITVVTFVENRFRCLNSFYCYSTCNVSPNWGFRFRQHYISCASSKPNRAFWVR